MTSGLARFTRDSTGPMLLGNTITQPREFQLRGSHPLRQAFPDPSPIPTVYHCATTRRHDHDHLPQHRTRNTRRLSHAHGLGSSAFARPLLTEYLFLRVLRCFTSPRHHPHPMNSGTSDRAQPRPGSPIRTPSDQSPLAGSPRHIAGCNVLLRLPVPRHPPNALQHLQQHAPTHNVQAQMLASTIRFPTTTPPPHTPTNEGPRAARAQYPDA